MNDYNGFEKQGRGNASRIWLGAILFIAGLALLAYKMGAPLPSWLFTWPMILILVGLFMGIKDKFQNPGSWILLLIGAIFLADQSAVGLNFKRYTIPIILIAIGLGFILKPRKSGVCGRHSDLRNPQSGDSNDDLTVITPATGETSPDAEAVNINSVFGGVKKIVLSKNFQGGTVNTFMGGAEINLLQADVAHPIILEVNNVFGGTKLVVPANWDVKNEVTAIFGGVEDKRNFNNLSPEPGKTVLIRGTCLFGGIEFSSY